MSWACRRTLRSMTSIPSATACGSFALLIFKSWVQPKMALRGVLNSWLKVARNSSFNRLTRSASWRSALDLQELAPLLRSALLLSDVGVRPEPEEDVAGGVAKRHRPREVPAELAVVPPERKRVFPGLSAGERRLPLLGHARKLGRIVHALPAPALHLVLGRATVFVPAAVVPEIQPSGFAIHASCGIEFAMASNRSCRLRARPSARRIDSIWSRFWYCRSLPRVAACTALTTERVGAGRSKSVTFPKSRSTRSVAADSMPPRIKRTIGKSDHEGCRSNTSRSAPISAVWIASSVNTMAAAPRLSSLTNWRML